MRSARPSAGSAGRDRRGLRGLLGVVGISLLGTRMSFLAVPWFVLVTTGSPIDTGLVAFAEMAPYVLVQAVGGPLVDRFGAVRSSVATDLIAAVAMGAVPLLHAVGMLALGPLAVLVGVAGVFRALGDSARDVLLPGVGELAAMPLERSSGWYDGVSRLASLIGAPVAGALIAASSAPAVLIIDAGTFVISAALVAVLVPRRAQPPMTAERAEPPASYLASLREGLVFLRADRLLLALGVMILITNLLDQAGSAVMLPVWATRVAHSSLALGLVAGALGLGAVLGNLFTAWLGPRLPRRWVYAVGFLIGGAPRFVALAVATTVGPVVAVAFAGGVGAGGINPILGAVSYSRVPRELQARVLGAFGALAWAGIPVGSLLGGWGVADLGLRPALLITASLYLATTLLPFALPVFEGMNRTPARPT